MVKRHYVKNWDDFEKLVTALEREKLPINVFFTGDKNELGKLILIHRFTHMYKVISNQSPPEFHNYQPLISSL